VANIITNRLTVTLGQGATPNDLHKFTIRAAMLDPEHHALQEADAPMALQVPYRLSFWNFKRPDPSAMTEYNDSSVGAKNGWYDWNNRNWGTKWDAWDVHGTTCYSGKTQWLKYDFATANGAPVPALEAMMEQFPNLNFQLRWQDEGGPGGEIQGSDGIWHETDRFGGALSHTEATDTRRLVKCQCLLTGGDYVPFPDCPVATE